MLEHQLRLWRNTAGSYASAAPSTEQGGATTLISIWKSQKCHLSNSIFLSPHNYFLASSAMYLKMLFLAIYGVSRYFITEEFFRKIQSVIIPKMKSTDCSLLLTSNHFPNSFISLVLEKVKCST